ncbi:MAG: hypothetical protein LUG98_03880 [Tannerellaceae bacterium]|nr:hypothetical protein [Tannerellaceae bacterium]
MGKSTGILLDPGTGDLKINTKRTPEGWFAGELETGYVTWQNQALILQACKGELKEYPSLGAAITEMANDNETVGWNREVLLQLESDGMTVRDVNIDFENKTMEIDAEYN